MALEFKSQYNIKRCTTIENIIQIQYHKLNGEEKTIHLNEYSFKGRFFKLSEKYI